MTFKTSFAAIFFMPLAGCQIETGGKASIAARTGMRHATANPFRTVRALSVCPSHASALQTVACRIAGPNAFMAGHDLRSTQRAL